MIFNCDRGSEYLQHALTCRPLYYCDSCEIEYLVKSYHQKHCSKVIKSEPKLVDDGAKSFSRVENRSTKLLQKNLKQEVHDLSPESKTVKNSKTSRNSSSGKVKKIGYGVKKCRSTDTLCKHKTYIERTKITGMVDFVSSMNTSDEAVSPEKCFIPVSAKQSAATISGTIQKKPSKIRPSLDKEVKKNANQALGPTKKFQQSLSSPVSHRGSKRKEEIVGHIVEKKVRMLNCFLML